jgi:hypothetical protein
MPGNLHDGEDSLSFVEAQISGFRSDLHHTFRFTIESVPVTNLTHAKVVWCDRYGLPVEGAWESKLSWE